MSAFLGPIHYWLYHKILVQERLVEMLLKLNEMEGYTKELEEETNLQCGVIEKRPLEEMIDTDNIHAWLQEKVAIVEKRLSFVVTNMVKDNADRMKEILDIAYELGEELYGQVPEEAGESAEKMFKQINDLVLDGMPCDRINEVLDSTDDEVVFRQTRCIHEMYWVEFGGLVMNYYDIRRKLLEGLLVNSAFEYMVDEDGNYHIRRK